MRGNPALACETCPSIGYSWHCHRRDKHTKLGGKKDWNENIIMPCVIPPRLSLWDDESVAQLEMNSISDVNVRLDNDEWDLTFERAMCVRKEWRRLVRIGVIFFKREGWKIIEFQWWWNFKLLCCQTCCFDIYLGQQSEGLKKRVLKPGFFFIFSTKNRFRGGKWPEWIQRGEDAAFKARWPWQE